MLEAETLVKIELVKIEIFDKYFFAKQNANVCKNKKFCKNRYLKLYMILKF